MASVKASFWVFIHFFGWGCTVLSIPGKIGLFLNIPSIERFQLNEPYQTVISWLAIIYFVAMIVRYMVKTMESIESWRHKRLINNERAHKLKMLRQNEK